MLWSVICVGHKHMKLFIYIVMKRTYLFNTVAWNYRKKIGFPVCKKENFAGLQVHRKRGKSTRASPTPHHTLNEERSARFTAQPLSALVSSVLRLGIFLIWGPTAEFKDITLAARENKFVSVVKLRRANSWHVWSNKSVIYSHVISCSWLRRETCFSNRVHLHIKNSKLLDVKMTLRPFSTRFCFLTRNLFHASSVICIVVKSRDLFYLIYGFGWPLDMINRQHSNAALTRSHRKTIK